MDPSLKWLSRFVIRVVMLRRMTKIDKSRTLAAELEFAWDLQVDCGGDAPCTRPARWRINLHGCEQANMCGQHKTEWLRRALTGANPRCAHCGTEFACVQDAFTVIAI